MFRITGRYFKAQSTNSAYEKVQSATLNIFLQLKFLMKISGADSRFVILGAVLTKTKTVFNFFSKQKKKKIIRESESTWYHISGMIAVT